MCKKILLFIYIATPFLCCGKRDSLAQFICLYRSKPLGRDKSPPSESVKEPCLLIKNKKESEGFEPPEPLSSTVFKTAAIDHSAISPRNRVQKYCFFFKYTNF